MGAGWCAPLPPFPQEPTFASIHNQQPGNMVMMTQPPKLPPHQSAPGSANSKSVQLPTSDELVDLLEDQNDEQKEHWRKVVKVEGGNTIVTLPGQMSQIAVNLIANGTSEESATETATLVYHDFAKNITDWEVLSEPARNSIVKSGVEMIQARAAAAAAQNKSMLPQSTVPALLTAAPASAPKRQRHPPPAYSPSDSPAPPPSSTAPAAMSSYPSHHHQQQQQPPRQWSSAGASLHTPVRPYNGVSSAYPSSFGSTASATPAQFNDVSLGDSDRDDDSD